MAVTIKDVAEYSGLSTSTISVVLNGKAEKFRISRKTVNKVLAAVKILNYNPNLLAKSLRDGYTHIIGFVVSDVSNAFFVNIAGHLEKEALKFGYRVVFGGANEDDRTCLDTIDAFVNLKVDGLVIVPTGGVADRLNLLIRQEVPFVLLDRYFDNVEADSVLLNNFKSGYDPVEYFLSKGRKRIATLHYYTSLLHLEERMDGYRAALAKYGIPYDQSLTPKIPFSDINDDEVLEIIRDLVENKGVDAIFFQTNLAARSGLNALQKLNYRIPEKVAVFCFNNNTFYDLLKAPVCSLAQPVDKLGIEAVRLLMDKINNVQATPPGKHIFDPEMIVERGMMSAIPQV
ncbi:MAG: LacI family transcriptional regulator [Bacteroidales bacterium]|jgi:LacI family transcriptional regulator|nr:LacI family transcriptional regulator [Bacteroidales bacterium]